MLETLLEHAYCPGGRVGERHLWQSRSPLAFSHTLQEVLHVLCLVVQTL
jgi:hypothetical protein